MSTSAIQRTIEEGRYDLKNPLSTDPEHLVAIREIGLRLIRDQKTDHRTLRATLDGAPLELGGRPVLWVVGAEIAREERRDLYDYRDADNRTCDPIDVLKPGDYPCNRLHASFRTSRGDFTATWSAYAVSGYWNK